MTQFINFGVGKSCNRPIETSLVFVGCGRYFSRGAPNRGNFLQTSANLGTSLQSGDGIYDWQFVPRGVVGVDGL